MPHTGKPSGACQPCKQRHVKCDEARPACGKCVKAKRVCFGYSEGLDLVLRNQNEAAKAGVDRRVHKNKSRSQTPENRLEPHPSTILVVPHPLYEPEETNALCFFVSTFVLFQRDTQADRGFVELLPFLFNSLRVESPLSLCLAAASKVLFGKWERKSPGAERHAFSSYAKALKATRVALQDPVESMADETLMAVCLLGFYEAATNAMNSKISPTTHFDGATALIQQRKNSRSMTALSKRLLIAVRSNIVFRAIQFSSPVETASGIWEEDLEDMPRNPATLLDLMSVDVADLLADAAHISPKVIDLSDEEDESSNCTDEVLERARAVDANLASWPQTLPLHWHPVRVFKDIIPKEVIDAGIYGDSCEVYPDIMICSTWNDWRVARLKVLRLMAKLSLVTSLERGVIRAHLINEIQMLVDGICASVPFCLGSRTEPAPLYQAEVIYPGLKGRLNSTEHEKTASAYGGWYLFSPFKETMQMGPYISKCQQEWLELQLWRLAKMYDVKPA